MRLMRSPGGRELGGLVHGYVAEKYGGAKCLSLLLLLKDVS